MKKRLSALLLGLILALSLCPGVAAAEEAADGAGLLCSPWAEDEVARALALGIAPGHPADLTAPITRAEFTQVAMDFAALQYRCPAKDFFEITAAHYKKQDPNDVVLTAFDDCDLTVVKQARFLGLINGMGDGRFEPDRTINRGEVAVLLLNTYRVYTGDLYAAESQVLPLVGTLAYGDRDSIWDWAAGSVSLMSQWNVMDGVTETEFGPGYGYTWEQCIITFLHLYDNAPASIGHEGKSLCPLTQKQLEQRVLDQAINSLYEDRQTVETDLGIVHFGVQAGLPHSITYYYFTILYRDGGLWRYTDGSRYGNGAWVHSPRYYDHMAVGEDPNRLLAYDKEGNKLLELDLLTQEAVWIWDGSLPEA